MEVLKELTESINEKTGVSRRSFLKGLGALSATAAIYGCGGGENLAQYKTEPSVTPQDNLVLDKELKAVMTSHPYNCGSRCSFRFHVKNGRMMKLTSAGDTPRAGATTADEAVDIIQRRSCPRGFAQIKRNYQPDRLKYPLKQTMERGNLRGFTRISWDEALDTIAKGYQTVTARKDKLGYIPATGFGFNYFGIALNPQGAPSFENYFHAKYGAIGNNTENNYIPDILNSKFILNFGIDASVSFSWQPHIYWWLTKAKEKGIPVVTIEPAVTDTVTTLSTGYSQYGLPSHINVRVESDSAILTAMANVIYRKKLHDEAYIKQYCFGFYPGDAVVSQSAMKNPLTGQAYAGQTFTTPTGMSFVEYLDSIETEHGGYNGVLQWASNLSGVSTATIENLAVAYASTKPAFLYGGWGPCRTGNGMSVMWLFIALAAMTGNTNKRGGGAGFANWMANSLCPVTLGATKETATTATTSGAIAYSANCLGKVVFTGIDNRTPEQMRADALAFNKVDLGAWTTTRDDVNGKDGRLRIEMIAFGGNAFNQRIGSLTFAMLALKDRSRVKFTYCMDNFMTPTMAYSDIVLPQTTHLEENRIDAGGQWTVAFMYNKVIEPMFECKTSYEIQSEILKKLGINYGIYGPRGKKTDLDLIKEQWAGAKISTRYAAIDSKATLPTFEEFQAKGVVEFPVPVEQAYLGTAATNAAGKFPTDTGKINFFSPFYFNRDKALGDKYKKADGGYYRTKIPPRVGYERPIEGYPDIAEGKVSAKGIKYSLQINTKHHRRRAHSVYDNVAVIREQFPGSVVISGVDAAARGISNGDTVYVFNDWGCVKVQCVVTRRIKPGLVTISDGEWYRPSATETYEAWIDVNGDGISEKQIVPVDVGGAPNSLMHNWESGPLDPSNGYLGDNNWNGHLVEVSKTHPDKK